MQTFERIIFEELNPGFFSAGEILVSRAPGRIDLMGGIADYSGSLVLQWPIAAATHVAIQLQQAPTIDICSVPSDPEDRVRACAIPLTDLEADVESVRAKFASDPAMHWAAYVAGAFTVLDRGLQSGAKILISSAVPEGKGVSSSAALEVAAMTAIAAAYDLEITPQEIAFLSQRVENTIAGAPCGVMDQMTSACGERDRLLAILCQPGELQGTISLPNELAIWGIDSGIRHSVAGADYGTVRTAAFMGYRIITEIAADPKWNGYLANITPEEFDKNFAAQLPAQMLGADFLDRYRSITDSVTSVVPHRSYPVFAATKHPVYENARVIRFAEILMNWEGLKHQADTLGELMYQSHLSYSTCGLGSDGTDELVRLAQEENDVYGAKITGGGSGGTVAVLALKSAQSAIDRIAETYHERTGYQPTIISGSSDGAGKFGTRRL
jgi:L-arabinokinase